MTLPTKLHEPPSEALGFKLKVLQRVTLRVWCLRLKSPGCSMRMRDHVAIWTQASVVPRNVRIPDPRRIWKIDPLIWGAIRLQVLLQGTVEATPCKGSTFWIFPVVWGMPLVLQPPWRRWRAPILNTELLQHRGPWSLCPTQAINSWYCSFASSTTTTTTTTYDYLPTAA